MTKHRQNKRANTGEVSADAPVNALTRKTVGIIPFTGNTETDAEIMRKLFGAFQMPAVSSQDSTPPLTRQALA